ncbi:MAG: M67 family metallopeptidase [Clostridiales bacterium]|jgi:proteasome lid subunit RPN8/RPN11|nr:M67 family metallopeptidase [Clostridiales bacterium]
MIRFSRAIAEAVKDFSENEYPNECCGVILGRMEDGASVASQLQKASNSSEESARRRRFSISPEELMKADVRARKLGLDVIGFYHSHPDAPAVPSERDRELAFPVYSYVIVSVMEGKARDFRSWVMRGGAFGEEVVEIC